MDDRLADSRSNPIVGYEWLLIKGIVKLEEKLPSPEMEHCEG